MSTTITTIPYEAITVAELFELSRVAQIECDADEGRVVVVREEEEAKEK